MVQVFWEQTCLFRLTIPCEDKCECSLCCLFSSNFGVMQLQRTCLLNFLFVSAFSSELYCGDSAGAVSFSSSAWSVMMAQPKILLILSRKAKSHRGFRINVFQALIVTLINSCFSRCWIWLKFFADGLQMSNYATIFAYLVKCWAVTCSFRQDGLFFHIHGTVFEWWA